MSDDTMRTVSSTEFQRNIGEVTNDVLASRRPVTVRAHGRRQVVIVHPDEYDALLEARRQLAWERLSRLAPVESSVSR